MEQSKLKIGDCVMLKHGGANIKMTIDFIGAEQGVPVARCKWYNSKDGKFDKEVFALDALMPCSSAKDSPAAF